MTIPERQKPAPQRHDHVEVSASAPVTPSPGLLNKNHQRFCQEYAVDLNGTQAYMRAYPGVTEESAARSALRLMESDQICREIQRVLDERALATGITADRALIRAWEMATADPRELVDVVVGACRYCHGLYHEHQYTEGEWSRELDAAISAGQPAPPEKGGTGYNPNRPPNPDCPECFGDGEPRTVLRSLEGVSRGVKALFRGVKYDKQGRMQVVMESSQPMLRAVMEHLGLLSGKLPGPQVANPLQQLLEEIRGRHGAATSLQVVAQDPEQRDRPQPTHNEPIDVESREVKPAAGVPIKTAWRKAT